jgi:hypothetical protein
MDRGGFFHTEDSFYGGGDWMEMAVQATVKKVTRN